VNVATLLSAVARERPDAPALVTPRGTISFGALDARSSRIAQGLAALGVGAGDGVLFFEPPSIALYASLAAVFRLGAVAMFVEPSAGRAVLEAACAMWPPRAFVATPRAHLLRLIVPGLRRIPVKISTGGWVPGATTLSALGPRPSAAMDAPRAEGRGPRARAAGNAVAAVADDHPALLTFTSGSTGAPKAAVRTHGILRAQLEALGPLTARRGEREMVSLPIVVLLNLASGAETVLPDADLRRPGEIDARPVLAQLRAHVVERLTASPAFVERLLDAPPAALTTLRTVVTGGGPVFPDVVERLERAAPGVRVVTVYGSTEAEPIAHVANDEMSERDREAMRAGAGLLVGSVAPVATVRLIAAHRSEPSAPTDADELDRLTVPLGEVGEIVVAGPHVVRGYLHGRGDAESKIRVDDVVWHRTGDLGRFDEHGRLWLLGRASAAIVDERGTLYPFAVECAARHALGGGRVAVIAHAGRRLLVVERSAAVDRERLRGALSWARLDDVVAVDRIPLDRRHNSKVDHASLERLLLTRDHSP